MIVFPLCENRREPIAFDDPPAKAGLAGGQGYLSPAPQAEPQAAGFSSGLPDAPQAEPQAVGFSSGLSAAPQAAGLSDAPQEEPDQPDRLESAMVVYLQFMFVEPVFRFAILS